jgi:hypothetical protein
VPPGWWLAMSIPTGPAQNSNSCAHSMRCSRPKPLTRYARPPRKGVGVDDSIAHQSSLCACGSQSLAHLAQAWRDDAGSDTSKNLRSLLRNFGESYRGDPVPEIWRKELARLYRLTPIEPMARLAIAQERELRQQDAILREQDFPGLDPALKYVVNKTRAQVIQEAKADMRRARLGTLNRVEVLAPPGEMWRHVSQRGRARTTRAACGPAERHQGSLAVAGPLPDAVD